jgi:hypothetical protein
LASALTAWVLMRLVCLQDASELPTLRPCDGKVGSSRNTSRSRFGDIALVIFLLAQASDGVLTYIGVSTYGVRMEGNPFIGWLMCAMGQAAGLATAKIAAGFFGIALHLSAVHKAVALLAVFYVAVAVVPWVTILFY